MTFVELVAVSVSLAVGVVTCAVVWSYLARVHRSTDADTDIDSSWQYGYGCTQCGFSWSGMTFSQAKAYLAEHTQRHQAEYIRATDSTQPAESGGYHPPTSALTRGKDPHD